MQIDGMISETKPLANGTATLFYPAEGSKFRHIRLRQDKAGQASAELIEGNSMPGLDVGEKFDLTSLPETVADRLLRAMAALHLDVEEAANGYTAGDIELIARGFGVKLSKLGIPAWVKLENGLTHIVSKPGEQGLPPSIDAEIQAIVAGPLNARVVVVAPNMESLWAFLDTKGYLGQLQANATAEFTIFEEAIH